MASTVSQQHRLRDPAWTSPRLDLVQDVSPQEYREADPALGWKPVLQGLELLTLPQFPTLNLLKQARHKSALEWT